MSKQLLTARRSSVEPLIAPQIASKTTLLTKAKIVDMLGREIKSISNSTLAAGAHTFSVDASSIESGMYFIKAEGNGINTSVKFIVAD